MFSVYVLENKEGKRYTGSTQNLVDRLAMHNDCTLEKFKFHKTTYRKGPWEVVFSKEFITRKEALSFEFFLKSGTGRKWLVGYLLLERARLGG